MAETLYKVTGANGSACHGGTGTWRPNRWRSVNGELIACQRGLHLVSRNQLIGWLGPVIWEAEYDGERLDAPDKIVVRRARLIRRLDTWNDRTARLFAADCAEHVLPIFERAYPTDDRPRKAIEAARAYARGEISAAARDAAGGAAWAAAGAVAGAAGAVAGAAWAAAGDAAGDAAGAVAGAAWAAAGDAFQRWAIARLFQYLDGELS